MADWAHELMDAQKTISSLTLSEAERSRIDLDQPPTAPWADIYSSLEVGAS